MGEKGYRKLIVWQKSDDLAYQIYIATKDSPKEAIYGVTSELRRTALSVPTNIVGGVSLFLLTLSPGHSGGLSLRYGPEGELNLG
jgi:hypothetical protein